MHIPAPKPKLPGHDASYNPPLEYLPTEEEVFYFAEFSTTLASLLLVWKMEGQLQELHI